MATPVSIAQATSLDARLVPERIHSTLWPVGAGHRLDETIHRVDPPRGSQLRIRSNDGQAHLLFVHVAANLPNRWVRWNLAIRHARELQGGAAVDTHDRLLSENRSIVLMVYPGEERCAHLDFQCSLDGESAPGTHPFQVEIYDITGLSALASAQTIDEVRRSGCPKTSVAGLLEVRHPESTFLDMLPGIYREAMDDLAMREDNPAQPPFFERYLVGFEDFFRPLRALLNNLDRLFSTHSTPPDFVLWLAAWVCMPVDEKWEPMRQRQLIREAVELFRWRGTKRGLTRYLEIYTGAIAEIDDYPIEGMRLGSHAQLGTDQTVLGDVPPHTFVVTLPVEDPTLIDERSVHDIIRYAKPAHTAYRLSITQRSTRN